MRAGIITIPGRPTLPPLVELIEPSVDALEIFVDVDRRGHWWNLERCMRTVLPKAAVDEPVLILMDDATTVPDWRERWEKIHAEAQNDIYVMFARQRHLFTPENIARGWVTKSQKRGFYDLAAIFINRPTLMDDALRWYEATGKYEQPLARRIPPPQRKHLDVVIQEFLLSQGTAFTITIPTLFDHMAAPSTLGHGVGGSPLYIGLGQPA
jgi:hypothetical protein